MEIEQRLLWASRADGIACFFEGMFVRFYQAQLAWYCQQIKPIKVCTRQIKKLAGRQIYYGGIPKQQFNAWLAQAATSNPAFSQQPMSWGVWLALTEPIDTQSALAWCAEQATLVVDEAANPTTKTEGTKATNLTAMAIVQQLRTLPLAEITPLQALHCLSLWQHLLTASDGATKLSEPLREQKSAQASHSVTATQVLPIA